MAERKVIQPPPLVPDLADEKTDVFRLALWMIAHDCPDPQKVAQAALDRFKEAE